MEATFPAFALVMAVVIMGCALWSHPLRAHRCRLRRDRSSDRAVGVPVARLLHQRWRAWQRRTPRRALERAKSAAIASLQEGDLTKITGVIAPRAPMLRSAVERRRCIGYSIAVEATDDTGWRPV